MSVRLRVRFVKWLLLLLPVLGVPLAGAVLSGTVVEAQTGKPLDGALVAVQPIVGGGGATQSVRADQTGAFQFPSLPPGAYLVTAARRAFAPVQYGQRSWTASGKPVLLTEGDATVLRIALPRYGAITGRVVDENDVGLSEHQVVAFRNARPLAIVAKAITDDRGVYRLAGLEPGSYLVRTATRLFDDGGYVPTYYRDVAAADSARPVDVTLDEDMPDINVHAVPGRVYTLAGTAPGTGYFRAQTQLTLISDSGAETVGTDATGHFQFAPVAPGRYELYAVAFGTGRRVAQQTYFQQIEIDRDRPDTTVNLQASPEARFFFVDTDGKPVDSAPVQVIARHKRLNGDSAPEYLRLSGDDRVTLEPGRWEFSLAPNYSFYVAKFNGANRETGIGERADGGNEVLLTQSNVVIQFALSMHPAALHGVVANAEGALVAGVPVFLEPRDAGGQHRAGDLRQVRTDMQGQFQFTGLAPGKYRLLSSFEFQTPDAAQLDKAEAATVTLEEGIDKAASVMLYVAE